MKATSGLLPTGPDWVYELKWDGMRLLVEVAGSGVRAWSSNGREATATFPELATLGPALAPLECLLDGEVVALDDAGQPSFERLQHRMHVTSAIEAAHRAAEVPIERVVFDILRLGDRATAAMPWRDRRHLLEQLSDALPTGVSLATVFDDGERLLDACRARGLEGVIAKRRDAPLHAGSTQPELGDYVQRWRWCHRRRPRVGSAALGCVDDKLRAGVGDVAGVTAGGRWLRQGWWRLAVLGLSGS